MKLFSTLLDHSQRCKFSGYAYIRLNFIRDTKPSIMHEIAFDMKVAIGFQKVSKISNCWLCQSECFCLEHVQQSRTDFLWCPNYLPKCSFQQYSATWNLQLFIDRTKQRRWKHMETEFCRSANFNGFDVRYMYKAALHRIYEVWKLGVLKIKCTRGCCPPQAVLNHIREFIP